MRGQSDDPPSATSLLDLTVAITFSIDPTRRRLDAVAEGTVTLPEILEHVEKERVEQGLPLPELIDATRATGSLTPAEVRQLVDRLRELGEDNVLGPTAVVVGNDLAYGILRMLEILVEDACAIRPFRNRRDAEDWLEAMPAPPPPARPA
jgi:hypothetical protein